MKALVMVESTPQECYSINILHGPSFWMISEFTSNLVQSAFHTTNRRPKGAHAGSWNHHKQEWKDCYWHSRPSSTIKEQIEIYIHCLGNGKWLLLCHTITQLHSSNHCKITVIHQIKVALFYHQQSLISTTNFVFKEWKPHPIDLRAMAS